MSPGQIQGQIQEKTDAARRLISETLARGKDVCVTSSFQTECVALVHLLIAQRPDIPVLFLDTGYHFAETYTYRDEISARLKLNLVNLKAAQTVPEQESQFGLLYQTDPGRCCGFRKVEPLFAAVGLYDVWFTGLRRDQSPTRANLKHIDDFQLPSGKKLLKVSPLADWTTKDVWDYLKLHDLPVLPLYDRGYTSIGCEPCTSLPFDPEIRGLAAGRVKNSNAAFTSRPSSMLYLVGFLIAALVGLTGVGAGSLTAPILILFFGMAPAESVGVALIFGAVTKISVVPVYVMRRQVNLKVLALLCAGGLPGVLAGSLLLERLDLKKQQNALFLVLGATVLVTALYSLYRSTRTMGEVVPRDHSGYLPVLAAAIGAEVGFSSAGAGALGSLALLMLTPLPPATVVGTDLSFGLFLSVIGGGFHLFSGQFETAMLSKLIIGGLAGAFAGASLAGVLPSRPLRIVLCVALASLGAELCWKALA